MSLGYLIAQRFRRGKQKNRYISFISFSSTLGIGLGCFVLIVLLSIMNGFEKELRDRLLAVIPHGELHAISHRGIFDWEKYAKEFSADPRVKKVQPYTKLTGMIQQGKQLKAVELTGIDVNYAQNDAWIQQVSDSDWQGFQADEQGVLLGQGIIDKLGLSVGDRIAILIPSVTDDLSFKAPKTMHLTVSGALAIGGEMDNLMAMMHLSTASKQAEVVAGAQGLRFTFNDPFDAYQLIREFGYSFPQAVYMPDWTLTQGHLYDDIQLVRVVVYIALTLVIAVACFNIVSTLVMAVREKRAAIAILKTMGAPDKLIKQIFMLHGLLNGVVGISVGTVCAILVAPNVASIVQFVENVTGHHLLSGDIYFIDFLPSDMHWFDVGMTVVVALVLSVLATLYPAHRAAKISPASALNG